MKKYIALLTILSALVITIVLQQNTFADKPLPPLSEKEILVEFFKNTEVLLANSKHCAGVGMAETDRTIGDYLSGFWSMHTSKQGQNWLEVSATITPQQFYLAKVMIYRKDGEENWGWGVSFELDSARKLRKGSFTCLGAS